MTAVFLVFQAGNPERAIQMQTGGSTNTSISGLRVGLIVLFVLLLLMGVSLAYFTSAEPVNYDVITNTLVCQQTLTIKLIPNQTEPFNCTLTKNNWFVLSLQSSANVTVTVLFSINSTYTVLFFNQTGTSFSLTLPVFTPGSLSLSVGNYQNAFVTIKGSAFVNEASPAVRSLILNQRPYIVEGYSLTMISLVFLFLLIWNPRRLTTKFLTGIALGWKKLTNRAKNFRYNTCAPELNQSREIGPC